MNRPVCPICQKSAQEPYHPFCSKRCSHVDLNRWFSGDYAIEGAQDEAESPDDEEI